MVAFDQLVVRVINTKTHATLTFAKTKEKPTAGRGIHGGRSMAKTLHIRYWRPRVFEEFYTDCEGESLAFEAMYSRLLDYCWRNENWLPVEEEKLKRICACSDAEWDQNNISLMNLFLSYKDCYRHEAIRQELTKAKAISKVRQAASAKGVAARVAKKAGREAKERRPNLPISVIQDQWAIVTGIEEDGTAL